MHLILSFTVEYTHTMCNVHTQIEHESRKAEEMKGVQSQIFRDKLLPDGNLKIEERVAHTDRARVLRPQGNWKFTRKT